MGLFKPNVDKMEAKKDVLGLMKVVLKDRNQYIRINAVRALGEIGEPQAVELLIHILKNYYEDVDVRREAVKAFGKIFGKMGEPAVKSLMVLLFLKSTSFIFKPINSPSLIPVSRKVKTIA